MEADRPKKKATKEYEWTKALHIEYMKLRSSPIGWKRKRSFNSKHDRYGAGKTRKPKFTEHQSATWEEGKITKYQTK